MPRPVDHQLRDLALMLTAHVESEIARLLPLEQSSAHELAQPLRQAMLVALRSAWALGRGELEDALEARQRPSTNRAFPPPFPRDDQTPTKPVSDRDLDETRSFRTGR